jgi:hypothetical protein
MAGLVPAISLRRHRRAHLIGIAGTSPAMTKESLIYNFTRSYFALLIV